MYIGESGKYAGEFINGKPHGKGKYYEFVNTFQPNDLGNSQDTFFSGPKNLISNMVSEMKTQKQKNSEGLFFTAYEG